MDDYQTLRRVGVLLEMAAREAANLKGADARPVSQGINKVRQDVDVRAAALKPSEGSKSS